MVRPSSVLLIKLRHHGDVLLATPVARTLKDCFPKCHVDFLVYEGTEQLLKGNSDIRDVFLWHRRGVGPNRSNRWSRLWKIFQLFLQLRRRDYDWVIHLSDQMQGALLAKLLAREQSIGIDYPKRRDCLWRFCFSTLTPLFPSNTHHSVEQNLATLQEVLANTSTHSYSDDCRLVINQQDRADIQKKLQEGNITTSYLLVHPTARWFFKCWEEDRFAQVIEYFANQGWSIVLTSGPEEAERAMVQKILQHMRLPAKLANEDEMLGAFGAQQTVYTHTRAAEKQQSNTPREVKSTKKSIDVPRVYSLAGQLTLTQLAAAIEGAHLFIGVDSVPMHMAAALQKDIVALFGASKVHEWHPWKTRYCLLQASDYGPLPDPDDVKTATRERYLARIPVEDVIAKVEEMLSNGRSPCATYVGT